MSEPAVGEGIEAVAVRSFLIEERVGNADVIDASTNFHSESTEPTEVILGVRENVITVWNFKRVFKPCRDKSCIQITTTGMGDGKVARKACVCRNADSRDVAIATYETRTSGLEPGVAVFGVNGDFFFCR